MATALLQTKLHIPPVQLGLVSRLRLNQGLNRCAAGKPQALALWRG